MENTSIWIEEDQERYIARSREADMQSTGQLVAQVIAVLRTKLDGSHINTYVARDKHIDITSGSTVVQCSVCHVASMTPAVAPSTGFTFVTAVGLRWRYSNYLKRS